MKIRSSLEFASRTLNLITCEPAVKTTSSDSRQRMPVNPLPLTSSIATVSTRYFLLHRRHLRHRHPLKRRKSRYWNLERGLCPTHSKCQRLQHGLISLRHVTIAGTYYVWGRVLAPNSSSDSFYVSMDGGAEDVYDVAENIWSTQWQWTKVNGRGLTGIPLTLNPRTFVLTAGSHVIRFRVRDANSKLDRIFITDDPK